MRVWHWAICAIVLALFATVTTLPAFATPGVPRAAPTQTVMVQKLPPPVTSANFDPDKATAAYLAKVSPTDRAKAAAFATGNHWLMLLDLLVTLAIAAFLLFTRLSAAMRNLAARITRSRTLQSALYAIGFLTVVMVLTFPLAFYEGFLRRHAYGISNLSFAGWLGEFAISFGVQLVIGTLLLTAIYAVIRATPRFWWAWGTLVAVAFLIFGMLIYPVFILPLFNKSTPLKAGPLRSAIVRLAEANGVPSKNIYVVNTSKQSNLLNANVSGMFGTTRISLNDTLLTRCTNREILAVVAHEMGHYVLGHTVMFLPWMALIIFVGFGFVQWGFGMLAGLFGGNWDVRVIADPAGLPLIYALFSLYLMAATPFANTLSRHIEAQADIFGLNAARQPDAFAKFFLLDTNVHDLTPGHWEEILFWNHPSAKSRISMAMHWKAAHLSDPDIVSGPISPQ